MSEEPDDSKRVQEELCEVDDDPFNVDKLIVDYDYILYKILDRMESIQMKTTEICRRQHDMVEHGIVEEIIDKNIAAVENLLIKCDELERHYDQLAAVREIAQTFNERLKKVVGKYKEYIE